jgi:hypothetical protein
VGKIILTVGALASLVLGLFLWKLVDRREFALRPCGWSSGMTARPAGSTIRLRGILGLIAGGPLILSALAVGISKALNIKGL